MATGNNDYTDQAMKDHAKTYAGFLTMLKVGMVLVALALGILMIIYKI